MYDSSETQAEMRHFTAVRFVNNAEDGNGLSSFFSLNNFCLVVLVQFIQIFIRIPDSLLSLDILYFFI